MNILFKDIDILTMDGVRDVIFGGFVAVEGDRISYVGEQPPRGIMAQRVVSGQGKLLMPGLVNAHTHLPMTALRGYADDLPLDKWLFDRVFPVEDRLDGKSVLVCTLIGIAESIAAGTTSVSDMYFFCDAIAAAVAKSGIRANLSRGVTYTGEQPFSAEACAGWAESLEFAEKWHNAESGRIKTDFAVHAEYTTRPDVWETVAAFAREKNLRLHFHLSETKKEHDEAVAKYGKTPARLFYEAGLLSPRALAAHCVWVTEEDMDLLAQSGTSVVSCPCSNLKLGSGIAPLAALASKGINIALGTDGSASNNSLDMFGEMKTAALLQKGVSLKPGLFPALEVIRVATAGGAKAQGRENEIGMIKEGYAADIIMLDLDRPALTPCHEPASAAVYSARGGDVELTMVSGEILYEKGAFTTIDWERLKYEFFSVAKRLFAE